MDIGTSTQYSENFEAISDTLKRNGFLKVNRGAEIGVRHGVFSEYLLDQHPGLSMCLVDPYEPYLDCGKQFTRIEQLGILRNAVLRMHRFEPRVTWYCESSVAAAAHVMPFSLDFAFIDANHDEVEVRADLLAWASKVRHGGLFCGHDYDMAGVGSAVRAFASELGVPVQHIGYPADVWLIEMR